MANQLRRCLVWFLEVWILSDYLFLTKVDEKIENIIYLSQLIPNRQKNDLSCTCFKVGIYLQKFNSLVWHLIDEIFFSNDDIFINSSDYDINIGELLVVVPVYESTKLDKECVELPKPISRKVDNSPVNERGEIRFKLNETSSSYLGEFPHIMSTIKGTFLSFDPLIQSADGIKNKLIFINIHSKKISKKEPLKFYIAHSKSKKIIDCYDYYLNSALIIDIDQDSEELCFFSRVSLGIPIFISYNSNQIISVEHTHPPAEMFWEKKFLGQKILKSNWLERLQ